MNMAIIEKLAEETGMQILKKAPEFGAKLLLGVPVEIGVYFASKKLIAEIEKAKEAKQKQVVVEA